MIARRPPSSEPPAPPSPPVSAALRWGLPAAVALLALLPFLPALGNGFVDWDDEVNFVENPRYRGLSPEHLGWMFTTSHKGHYQPLSWVTHGLVYSLGGMNPVGYHLANLILHAANAALFFCFLLAVLRKVISAPASESGLRWSAAAGALFFAVHPLRVESVAWATERRDVLCGFFYLLTLLAYLRMQGESGGGRRRWLACTVGCFLLSLLSKAWGITLPLVLLVLDLYPLRRLARGGRIGTLLLEKTPFLLLALAAAYRARLAQLGAGAMLSLDDHTLASRAMQAAYGLCFYVRKTLLPLDLSPLYELERRLDPTDPRYVAAALAVVALTGFLVLVRRRSPAGLAAWAAYAIVLFPVLGFFQSGPQRVADRYTYLACLPWAVLAAAGLHALARESGRLSARMLGATASCALLLGLGGLTFRQTRFWRNSVTLWEQAVRVDPTSPVSQSNLGTSYDKAGRLDEAILHYGIALDLRPEDLKTRHNLALAYAKQKRYEAAVAEWTRIVEHVEGTGLRRDQRLTPEGRDIFAESLYSLGVASFRLGRDEDAVRWYGRALDVDPRYAEARQALGTALRKQAWESALAKEPGDVAAHNGLGLLLIEHDRLEEAEAHFRAALRAREDDPDSLTNLGALLARTGRREEALLRLRRALAVAPNHPLARRILSLVEGKPAPDGR